ncbi:hypothetical protein IVA80_05985 [Bradyrhizobium sp. 139]|uniref:hypothetical protein n=1 Tax=Bradyrhizobium sp. 139 TaxID=2782616 RepID=UPI001FF7D19A|nr:hypothetical protein [Bradyrhizobium sp. 139]MCK1740426.1 hypothetical protein [Bradyrhizobium sp. 139]
MTDNAPKAEAIKADFVRLLSARINEIADNPTQMREMVYELARVKLLEQFTHADVRESRELQQILEQAIREVERSCGLNAALSPPNVTPAGVSDAVPLSIPLPPAIPKAAEPPRRAVAPSRPPGGPKRNGAFNSLIRLSAILLLITGTGAALVSWPRMKAQFTALWPIATPSQRSIGDVRPQATAAPSRSESETAERLPDGQKEAPPQTQPSMPLPTTFGVYALSDGQLHELKSVPGKIPDRRVAISAAITTPSATTLTSGDVRFIVFRPDGGIEMNGTEVRVVAKVSRAMGVDATGKAAMVSAGDSWVIRSMSFPYKVGPVEDQPRMLLLQPEQDGFTLTPGRYVVVVKGMGYDFSVAGMVTDPNQCVERINATNGAFYSPCPPRR